MVVRQHYNKTIPLKNSWLPEFVILSGVLSLGPPTFSPGNDSIIKGLDSFLKVSPVWPFPVQHLREYGADREVPALLVMLDKAGCDPYIGKIP